MTRGKHTCRILKEIRQQIAEKNDIKFVTSECNFQGECKGTCPKCEAELRYLENELRKRQQLGKAVTIVGISLGIASSFAACNNSSHTQLTASVSTKQELPESTNNTHTPSLNFEADSAITENSIATKAVVKKRRVATPNILECDTVMGEETILNPVIILEYYTQSGDVIAGGIVSLSSKKKRKGFIYNMYNIDKAPAFPNGDSALRTFIDKNLVYPQKAINRGIIGTTVVRFVVNTNGSVKKPKVLHASGNKMLDKQALSLARKLPRFTAGEEYGKKVRAYYDLPVKFEIAQPNNNSSIEKKLTQTIVEPTKTTNIASVDTTISTKNVAEEQTPQPRTPEFCITDHEATVFFNKNLSYPYKAAEENVSGTVVIKFGVNCEGEVFDITLVKKALPELDKEVLRVVEKLPLLIPEVENGKKVSKYYCLPVMFKLKRLLLSGKIIIK